MSYIGNPKIEDGGEDKVVVKEDNVKELLMQILLELKIMNIHLETLSEQKILEGDIK